MVFGIADINFTKIKDYADWKLLLFLLLFLDVKLAVKIPAIVVIYLLQFNFRFGFSLKNSRLPLFYLLILIIPVISFALNKGYLHPNYIIVFLTGMFFGLLCILAIHQVKLAVEKNDTETIHRTILVFFIINTVLSFSNLALIIWETGAINPYRYQGEYQKYFIGTGDYIRGLSFDTSTTNAVLSAFGVVYFLARKNAVMVLLSMMILLLTGSNFINITLIGTLALLFAFKTGRDQKSLIAICIMFLAVFMIKISPQNDAYVAETVKNVLHEKATTVVGTDVAKVDTPLSVEEKRRKIATNYLDSVKQAAIQNAQKLDLPAPVVASAQPVIKTEQGRILLPKPNIHTKPYQTNTDTSAEQRILLAFIDQHKAGLPVSAKNELFLAYPGKIISMLQTVNFLRQHPVKIVIGDGIGNFSSKLAFRATGLGFSGGYPAKHVYIHPDFLQNHLDVYLNFFSKQYGLHSLTNSPFSVYDQLLAEYGLLGLLAFTIYYFGFFAKHIKKLTYGVPLLLMLTGILFIDYWFEQLSVIIFFELLLLLNIKETANQTMSYEQQ